MKKTMEQVMEDAERAVEQWPEWKKIVADYMPVLLRIAEALEKISSYLDALAQSEENQ